MDYISIRQVLDDLLDDDMMKGLTLERAVDYAVKFIKKIGMPIIFDEKTAVIKINNQRGLLPCDFYEMIQVRQQCGHTLVYSLGSFNDRNCLTYKIQGNIIFTSADKDLEISYRAIKVDGEGFPLIIDNGSFADALELYIKKRHFTNLFNSGKISQAALQNTQQDYAFAVGQASTDLVRPSLDQMESFKNSWCTLLEKTRHHADGFNNLSNPEVRKF